MAADVGKGKHGPSVSFQEPYQPAKPNMDVSSTVMASTVSTMVSTLGPRTPTMGRIRDKDRKIGHRRVDDDGQVTYKKKPTSELMAAMQLGIGQSITSLASKPKRDLLLQDFSIVETVFFPKEGSNLTPAHDYSDFRFKTYAPIAFRYFRELFGIQPDDFLLSVCNEILNELSNPGASGSIFYITADDEFIIKTVQHKEADFLQELLPGYYMNLNQNPRTLLPKFYGLFCYQCGGKNIRFIIMNNLLPSSVTMHEKYDLKGSTYKRKASKRERAKKSPTLKDLNFMTNHLDGLSLELDTYNALVKTIERDCRVLQSFKIMDYSLLLGIHNLDQSQRQRVEEHVEVSITPDTSFSRGRSVRHKLAQYSTAMEAIQARSDTLDFEDDDIPPGGIPAKNNRGERLLLFVGVIDILQSYRLAKRMEHAFKSMVHDGDTISVHRPGFYSSRFQAFANERVFRKITSGFKHSPSKRRGMPGRQKSISMSEDSKVSEKGKDRDPESGAVGGRPDLLPANATPPRSFSESSDSKREENSEHGIKPSLVTTSPSFQAPEPGAPTVAGSGQLHSPAHSFSGSTPTHTEYTEGTPSFTTSSPSSSEMLDSTPHLDGSMGRLGQVQISEEQIELEISENSHTVITTRTITATTHTSSSHSQVTDVTGSGPLEEAGTDGGNDIKVTRL